ncbi:MAG TPA: hypothetical protein VK446_15700 [Methylocystis sp.]|nr:hypothetical protein [Methylocystis sp.]
MNLFKSTWKGMTISTIALSAAAMLGGAGGQANAAINDLYVASQNNSVYIVRTNASGVPTTLLTTLTVGTYPQVARANPSESEVWVVNGGDATITVINTSNFSQKTYSVGVAGINFPGYVVFNPFQNVAYIIDGGTNQVLFINTTTKKLLPVSVTVGNTPGYAGLSGDASTLYVSNYFDNTVSVVNVAAYSQTAVIKIPNTNPPGTKNPPNPCGTGTEATSGSSPQGVAVQDPFVYVLNGYSNGLLSCADGGNGDIAFQESTVNVIAEWNNQIVGTVLAGGPAGTATGFSVNGNWLYATNTGNDDNPVNTLAVINPAARTGGPSKVITLPNGWNGVAETDADPDPNDNLVYIAADQNGVSVLNSNTNNIVTQYALPADSNGVAFPVSIGIVTHWSW